MSSPLKRRQEDLGVPYHTVQIGPVTRRHLPVREVKPGVKVAFFNPLGDWELNEALGEALATKVPIGTDVLLMPDGKAQALLHVLGRMTRLSTVVAKKEQKSYMKEPVLKAVRTECTTSGREEAFYLGADEAAKLANKRVLIVDDVVSTGGSLLAMRKILKAAGAVDAGTMCAFVEGDARPGVICLGRLPVNDPTWKAPPSVKSGLSMDAKAMRLEAGDAPAGVQFARRSSLPRCDTCGMAKKLKDSLEGFDSSRFCTCDGF